MITQKTKINTALSVGFLLCVIIVVSYGWNYIQKLGAELETQVALVTTYTDREQKRAELLNLVETSSLEREELLGYILTRAGAPSFVTQGEQIAASQGVIYTTDSLEEVIIDDGFDQLLVAFTMEGAESDVLHMLKVIETFPYDGYVTSVQLDRTSLAEEGNVFARVKLAVTLTDV